jgi:hypothetical protein
MTRTNYAGMSVVDNRAPLGCLFVSVKAIGQRQWLSDWSMNEVLQVHLVFKKVFNNGKK